MTDQAGKYIRFRIVCQECGWYSEVIDHGDPRWENPDEPSCDNCGPLGELTYSGAYVSPNIGPSTRAGRRIKSDTAVLTIRGKPINSR